MPQQPGESRAIKRLVSSISTNPVDATPSWIMPYPQRAKPQTVLPTANANGPIATNDSSYAGGAYDANNSESAGDQNPIWQSNNSPRLSWKEMLFPHSGSSALFVGLLCALLGFAIVVQFRSTNVDQLASLRQDDLVRLLEEVTAREAQLDEEVARLLATRQELTTGTDQVRAALELAHTRASVEGILSGRLPAQGPGLQIEIDNAGSSLTARQFLNLLEELRNAGAEAIQVGEYRVVTSSTFTSQGNDIYLDGNLLPDEVTWLVIGDPATLDRALEIPGGALPQIRQTGATPIVTQFIEDPVEVTATANLRAPEYAQPVVDSTTR